ncbi:MAG: FmdB family zinc ribbon protein [Limnochordia bacterium]|nr:zinc ribbon domain-containing protein [Bacillota bacterium]
MPLYEFQCQSCDHKFEELCRSSDTDKVKCPQCGEKVKRLISAFGFASPGSGVSSASSSCGGCAGGSCSTCH